MSLSLTTGYHGTGTLSYSATGLPTGLNISSSTGQITGSISGTADTNSPYSVTITATDHTNTSSQTFNWTVNARVSFAGVSDQANAAGDAVSVDASGSDALNGTLTYSATGLPSGLSISSTTGLISGTIAVGADTNSPYAVTVTASDGTVSASQTFNWTVAHVSLVNPGPQASIDSALVSLQLQGRDADNDALTYTATGLPAGLSVNSTTGLISGTLASNADTNSPYNVTVTASDGVHSTSQTFLWTVGQVALTAPSAPTNTEGDSVSLQLQGQSSSGTLAYSASGLPDGLSINPTTGLISGNIAPGAAANGPFPVDVAASNGTVSSSQTFNWTINPVVNLTAPADQSNNEGDNVSLQMSATDTLNNTVAYSADGLPSGLSINSTTGLISGTVASGDSSGGPYAVTVTASDGTYSSSVTFGWNVTHTDTTALAMANPGTQTNVTGDSVNVQVAASDPDGIDTLTYSATNLPDGLDIDPFSGIISGVVADDAVSATPYPVTVTADDGNGQTSSQTFNWLINATPITAQAVPVSAIEGNDTGSVTVATFTTPDLNSQAGDFTAVVNWGDGNSDTATVSGGNGSFTVTDDHTYAEKGSYPITVQISDTVTGGSASSSTAATVTDAPLTLTGGFQLGDALSNPPNTFTVATFTDANSNAQASDYTALIDWGDGNKSQGYIENAGDGVYLIVAPHNYTLPFGTPGPLMRTVTVTLTDADGASATTTSTVVVGQLQAGVPVTMGELGFMDANTYAKASDFVAQGQTGVALINWGDGTSSLGTVTGGPGNGSGPQPFTITGVHTYAQDSYDQPNGVYAVTATVTDVDGNVLTGTQYVSVVLPPMAGHGNEVGTKEGVALTNQVLATFTEPDISDSASVFTAAVNWGDGSPLDTTVTVVGGNGLFSVMGSHTYTQAGEFAVSVQVFKADPLYVLDVTGRVWVSVPGGPRLTGPSVVPGNSQYQYSVNLGPGQLCGSSSPQWFVENADQTATSDAKAVATWVVSNIAQGATVPYQTELAADVQFDNKPGYSIVGVRYTFNHVTYAIWSAPIAVVQVVVGKVGAKTTFTTPMQTAGKLPTVVPPPKVITPQDAYWDFRSAAVDPIDLSLAGTGLPPNDWMAYRERDYLAAIKGMTPEVPEMILTMTNTQKIPAFQALASISLNSPAAAPDAYRSLELGFIQTIGMSVGSAMYKGGGERVIAHPAAIPADYAALDWLYLKNTGKEIAADPSSLWPWYGKQSVWKPSSSPTLDSTKMADAPGIAFPAFFQPGATDDTAVKMNATYSFVTYVAVTLQNTDQTGPFFPEYKVGWQLNWTLNGATACAEVTLPEQNNWEEVPQISQAIPVDVVPGLLATYVPYTTWEPKAAKK